MSAKRCFRCVALLLVGWRMIAQGPLVYEWNCTPAGSYPGSGCVDTKWTTNGDVYSTMTAVCTNDRNLFVDASADAYNCKTQQFISASTTKYSEYITSAGYCTCCSPSYEAVWACANQEKSESGGCYGPC